MREGMRQICEAMRNKGEIHSSRFEKEEIGMKKEEKWNVDTEI